MSKTKKSIRAGVYNTLCEQAERAVGAGAKNSSLVTVLLFAVPLFALGILLFALPQKDFSETENRTLETLRAPAGLFEFADGSFSVSFASFCQDQFPARDSLIGLHGYAELALLRRESNGVLLCADGYLIPHPSEQYENVEKNISGVLAYAKNHPDLSLMLAVAPRSIDVMQSVLPAGYDTSAAEKAWQTLSASLAGAQIDSVDLRAALQSAAQSGVQTHYRTDHHWTTRGAYEAYAALLRAQGEEPYPLSDFEEELASDAFFGTTWSKAGLHFVAPDQMEYYRYANDTKFRTEIAFTDIAYEGFYDRSFLQKKDKYASFLGGNYAMTTVTQENPEAPRERLLLIKDSYAHALAPFLARHYDLILVDLRYYKMSLADYLAENPVDRVLILENMDSLLTAGTLSLLAYE